MTNKKELELDELENVTGGANHAGKSGYNCLCTCTIYYEDSNEVPGVVTIKFEIDAYFDLTHGDSVAREEAMKYCIEHGYVFGRCEATFGKKYKVNR